MKSPVTSFYEAPRTQLVDRDTAGDTGASLPLRAQAAVRQKLLALVALQLLAVGAVVAALAIATGETARSWLHRHLVGDSTALVALGATTLGFLLLLFLARDTAPPLQWAALVLFSCAQALCLTIADLALGAHAVLLNCGFACVCVALMAAMAGWTRQTGRGDRGCGFEWLPAKLDEWDEDAWTASRQLWSAYATAALALVVACGLGAALLATGMVVNVAWSPWTRDALLLSCVAQLLIGFWVAYEVERPLAASARDASVAGLLIHVYVDLVAAAVALAVVAATCLCVAATEGGVGLASGALELTSDGCCTCVEIAGRAAAVDPAAEPDDDP